MMAANGLPAAAQGTSAIFVLTGHAQVWQLVVFAGVRGMGLGLYYPSSQGLLPQTVTEAQRAQANAISRTGRNSAGIGGAALGGVLVGVAGPGWGLAVDAASFAVAAALRAGLRFPALPAAAARENTLFQLREGWREFIARRARFGCPGSALRMPPPVVRPPSPCATRAGPSRWGITAVILLALGVSGRSEPRGPRATPAATARPDGPD